MNSSVIGISPFGIADPKIVIALCRAGALGVLDISRNDEKAAEALNLLQFDVKRDYGVLVSDENSCESLPKQARYVVTSRISAIKRYHKQDKHIIAQVCSLHEALEAIDNGVDGLIVKGCEAGGRVGEDTTYILLQKIIPRATVPVWAQGGIGLHTSAMVIAAGAKGVVLDSQLSLFSESSVPASIKNIVESMDGSETAVVAGHRIYARANTPIDKTITDPQQMEARLNTKDSNQVYLPIGQDGAFAKPLARRFGSVFALLAAVYRACNAQIRQARKLKPLSMNAPLAVQHGTRYPIVQGPMSSVSDSAAFAKSVAEAGALPFVALSLMQGLDARKVLTETKRMMAEKPWGVGLLGFTPSQLFQEQSSILEETSPRFALIAGGKPWQVRQLEKIGIETYLHVPSPSLLNHYLADGIRRFILEGFECGGHIGPRSSFVLWEAAVDILSKTDAVRETRVLFAGGIHDELSAAMVSVLAAPLLARGAKVGVLMGTAYLFTEEAVTTGAIDFQFQKVALECDKTVISETHPGHATRAAHSTYTDYFDNERERLESEEADPQAVWIRLETLNMGRLRLAAKAEEISDGSIRKVDKNTQLAKGLFMMGQAATLRKQKITVRQLHQLVSQGSTERLEQIRSRRVSMTEPKPFNIAIVGMACIFAEAENLDAYWRNILLAKDSITEVPDMRWNKTFYYHPNGKGDKTPSKWGGFIPDTLFEPSELRIPPRSLSSIDPAQLLSLQVTLNAFKDAGIDINQIDRNKVCIVFGTDSGSELERLYGFRSLYGQLLGEMPDALNRHLPILTEDSFAGVLANVIAGRISNRLDFGGINCSVAAACASSLAALDAACKELLVGTSNLAIVGGADLHNTISDYQMFSSVQALSPTGKCRAFSSSADGTVLGEGIAAVILKRLEDAQSDGDRVYAVIKSVGGSSDGSGQALTAPNQTGQIRALQNAYDRAGITADQIELIEAHGTGTVIGDKTELAALTECMVQAGSTSANCTLSSVKSLIGHTKCAAGLAGLIKAALSVYHSVLPPSGVIDEPNQFYDTTHSPFLFHNASKPWLSDVRRAGVSAFGFGGANYHVVLENTNTSIPESYVSKSWSHELFVFRGQNYEQALAQAGQLASSINQHSRYTLRDFAASVTLHRSLKGRVQIAMVVNSIEDLKEKLTILPNIKSSGRGIYLASDQKPLENVAFLFPGQGSQYLYMVSDLFVQIPRLRTWLARGMHYTPYLFPRSVFSERERLDQKKSIDDTGIAQPLLGIANMAMSDILDSLKIRPKMVGGHSYGEITALCYAGAIDRDQLIAISIQRAESILQAVGDDPGTMAVVRGNSDVVQKHIRDRSDVVVANQNAPQQTVISGSTSGIRSATQKLLDAGFSVQTIPVSCGFHSPLLSSAADLFRDRLSNATLSHPQLDVYSNVSARPYGHSLAEIRKNLCRQIVSTVRFHDQICSMYEAGARVFIEVGPSSVLTGLVGNILEDRPHKAIATNRPGVNALESLLSAVAQIAILNISIDLSVLFEGREAQIVKIEKMKENSFSDTAWLVNGQYARPMKGDIPIEGFKPNLAPITSLQLKGDSCLTDSQETAILEYFRNMREVVEGQRQAIMRFLGEDPMPMMLPEEEQTRVARSHIPISEKKTKEDAQSFARSELSESTIETDFRKPDDILIELLSEQTGYPLHMLDINLDLETDLGLDSIKRAELIGVVKEAFDLNVDGMEKEVAEELLSYRTLKQILSWLKARISIAEESKVNSFTDGSSFNTQEDPIQVLLNIVSERTGYPLEVLDVDYDLEADFGIDSIKKAEIFASLNRKYDLWGETKEELSSVVMEELATLRTIRAIGEFIRSKQNIGISTDSSSLSSDQKNTNEGNNHRDYSTIPELKRQILKPESLPSKKSNGLSVSGRRFAITDDGMGISSVLSTILESKGAEVRIIDPDAEISQVDGLIYLSAINRSVREPVKSMFRLTQQVIREQPTWIIGTAVIPKNESKRTDVAYCDGVTGFLKSLAQEITSTHVRAIEIDLSESIEDLANRLYQELLIEYDNIEVRYAANARYRMKPVESPLERVGSVLELNSETVVLITGGARGITATISIALAKRYGCKLELIGSTNINHNLESDYTAGCEDARSIKHAIARSDKTLSPLEIEKQYQEIRKVREIKSTLAAVKEAGSEVNYHTVDVIDEKAFGEIIDQIYKKRGQIDGVIHAAGVVNDKLLNQKSKESFSKVYDTKTKSAQTLVSRLPEDVRFVAFFSSITAIFGNRGQTDYAAANEYLDRLAIQLSSMDKTRVLSVNWGPWRGTGMVSPELERYYEERGVGLIQPEQGISAFMEEIQYGVDPQVMLVACYDANMETDA